MSLVVLLALLLQVASAKLLLVVQYCPTAFTSAGAVVSVDPASGKWAIESRFAWPGSFGCEDITTPTVAQYQNSSLWLAFDDIFVELSLQTLKPHRTVKPDLSFVGFVNMVPEASLVQGLSATVEAGGWCSDGCYSWDLIRIPGGGHTKLRDVPFREMADDCNLVANGVFHVQGAYPLTPEARCSPNDPDQCFIEIDMKTGQLLKSTFTNYTVYAYYPQPTPRGDVLTWMFGFPELCKHPYNNYLFATVNLNTKAATPIACIPGSVTDHMDEWIASFSPDGKQFATASGNTQATAQALVFDTRTGAAIVNTDLPGLGAALVSFQGLYQVWGVVWL